MEKDHKPIDNNLIIRPFPQGLPNPQVYWPQYRRDMISLTGTSIFILGNKRDKDTTNIINSSGVEDEYNISKEHGNFLIPVGATGYMSKVLWESQNDDEGIKNLSPSQAEMELLGDDNRTLDQLHDIIIKILKNISSK